MKTVIGLHKTYSLHLTTDLLFDKEFHSQTIIHQHDILRYASPSPIYSFVNPCYVLPRQNIQYPHQGACYRTAREICVAKPAHI